MELSEKAKKIRGQYNRSFYQKHREKILEQRNSYYKNNREKCLERTRQTWEKKAKALEEAEKLEKKESEKSE